MYRDYARCQNCIFYNGLRGTCGALPEEVRTHAWVCPKCGAVYGLGVSECWRCNRIVDNMFYYKTFCQEVK